MYTIKIFFQHSCNKSTMSIFISLYTQSLPYTISFIVLDYSRIFRVNIIIYYQFFYFCHNNYTLDLCFSISCPKVNETPPRCKGIGGEMCFYLSIYPLHRVIIEQPEDLMRAADYIKGQTGVGQNKRFIKRCHHSFKVQSDCL